MKKGISDNKKSLIQTLKKLRNKMTIPQMSDKLNIGTRKLERLLGRYKIRKRKIRGEKGKLCQQNKPGPEGV